MTRLRSRSKLARPYIWRLDHLDPVDVALDGSGAVRQGEAIEHGGVGLFEPGGEGVQVGLVAGSYVFGLGLLVVIQGGRIAQETEG